MTPNPAQLLPWRIGQRVEWLAHGGVHAGRLTTWRGPCAAGVYVLTVSEARAGGWVLVTLHAPGTTPPVAQIKEVARYA